MDDAECNRLFRKVEILRWAVTPEEFLEGRSRKIPKRLDNTDIVIEVTARLGGAAFDEKGMSELRRIGRLTLGEGGRWGKTSPSD